MNAVRPNQDITLDTLAVVQDGGGSRRIHINNMAAGLQNNRHAISRGRGGATLKLLVQVHAVDQVPRMLPHLVRLRQVNIPQQFICGVVLGDLQTC